MFGRNVQWQRHMLPLVSHGEYANVTDGRHLFMHSARCGQNN